MKTVVANFFGGGIYTCDYNERIPMKFTGREVKFTERDVRERRAIEKAVDVLPYGELNPRAREVAEEAQRKFREQFPMEDEGDISNSGCQ